MKRALLWSGAVAVAVPAIYWYAVDPRGLTMWVLTFAAMPIATLVLETANRRLPYRLQWAIALILAPAGAIAYLLWMDDQLWFYGMACAIPLGELARQREQRLRRDDADFTPVPYIDGPWGPP